MPGKGRVARNVPLNSEGQFIASRNCLQNNVLFFDPCRDQTLLGSGDESINNGRVPSRVDDANAKVRAYKFETIQSAQASNMD